MDRFLDMGGYGVFVWPAYGATAAVLVLLLVSRLGRLKRREAELERLEGKRAPTRREKGRRGPAVADCRSAGGGERA